VPVASRHAFIGPNGAGKSTLFNLISGELSLSSGRILLFGRDVTGLPGYRRAGLGLARTYQITKLFRSLTVVENVLLAVQALDSAKLMMFKPLLAYRHFYERAQQVLEMVGLPGKDGAVVSNLSYGEQRQLEIALALVGKPQVLLLDEPTAGLSPAESQTITDMLKNLDPAITLLLIEHDMDVAFELANRVTVLDSGRIIADGSVEEIRRNPLVQDVYLGSRATEARRPDVKPRDRQTVATAGPTMLDVQDIHTYYGDSYILQGVSLSVERGQFVAILGRNGMGKTTLIRSIMGLTPPKRGRVWFNGTDITGRPPYEAVELGTALVPQGRHIFSSLTVGENLSVAAFPRGPWTLERVSELFPRLKERIHQRGSTLSGGEQQMLAIARALMTNPQLLLMDEPTEGLSPLLVEELARAFEQLKEAGLSVLLVEQNLPFALQIADQVHIFLKGRIVHSGSPQDIRKDKEIKARYLGL
jgi:ABC-type branched-subunit amino acid transport system ATPase component